MVSLHMPMANLGLSNHVPHPLFKSAEIPTLVPRVQLTRRHFLSAGADLFYSISHLHLRGRKHSYLIDPFDKLQHVLISRLGPAAHLIGRVFARKRAGISPTRHKFRNLTGSQGLQATGCLRLQPSLGPMFIRAIVAYSDSSLVRSTRAAAPSRRSMPRILRPRPLIESYHIGGSMILYLFVSTLTRVHKNPIDKHPNVLSRLTLGLYPRFR